MTFFTPTAMKLRPCLFLAAILATAPTFAAAVDFSHDIVPLLKEHCGKCHIGQRKEGSFSLNTRELLLKGGDNGAAVVVGKSAASELINRLESDDKDYQMPPEGKRPSAAEIAKLKTWIDGGLPWESGFSFAPKAYDPPLKPRHVELPPAVAGRDNPVDRLIDAYLAGHKLPRPAPIDDGAFARRAFLDLIGLLPTSEELQAFLADQHADKRARLVEALLARNGDYAEHWFTFWNDLLRNDFVGTGYIDGGRKQVSGWLYNALVANMPYDEFARELIAPPTDASRGFIGGIKWRGDVSAAQTVEVQFSQNLGQTFLGINLKCASCHDSFIDRWKLDETYGLAAIFSDHPLEIYRCDKPTGRMASASWLFPEIGQVDAKAPQPERLKQLAGLMTHPDNGRFTRTIVNRLWLRLMGHGIVHPPSAMQTEPWDADLLDFLAADLAEHKYDLKHTLELIVTSQAYQSRAQAVTPDLENQPFVYAGPRSKRLTAEQFVDGVWQITGAAPTHIDAPIVRVAGPKAEPVQLAAKWIWSKPDASAIPAGATITLRRQFDLPAVPLQAAGVISCDNSYVLIANGHKVQAGDNWLEPDKVALTDYLKQGANELLIVATNGGVVPNGAALFFDLRLTFKTAAGSRVETLATDGQWQWTSARPDANGQFTHQPTDWRPAAVVTTPGQENWNVRIGDILASRLASALSGGEWMVRASLVKSDFLMSSLGRPNREQVVTVRPDELTTLEAIDLCNGQTLADALHQGAAKLVSRSWDSPASFVRWVFRYALSREPTADELHVLAKPLGDKLTEQGVEDVLWTVLMLPEFQLVR